MLDAIITNDGMLPYVLDGLRIASCSDECLAHAACVVLQRKLRSMLSRTGDDATTNTTTTMGKDGRGGGEEEDVENNDDGDALRNAVAFVADGSILPRRSGRSHSPMSCPPCVPFRSPDDSASLTRIVTVDVGEFWRGYLNDDGTCRTTTTTFPIVVVANSTTTVRMRGMIVPRGVTLIVGGGYHGKSTLLQALAYGVYDKVPYDGREYCVSHRDAVSVRAEDGRYVNNLNVSAFISNLPGGRGGGKGPFTGGNDEAGRDIAVVDPRTRSFGTRDASGSTSQAANVIEALESGASTLLVDEDVSAANFMARDGRMRAMIMDEPITPLLYRVNGLFLSREHGTSTIVVVGGVGEWLDVADAVVLMRDYVAHDGLAKARSVSYQFSYGHVQYAGRGVVHRLPWKFEAGGGGDCARANIESDADECGNDGGAPSKTTTAAAAMTVNLTLSPLRRRPCVARKFKNAAVHMTDSGSSRLEIYRDIDDDGEGDDDASEDDEDDDEDDGMIDMSKCMQLVSGGEQLYGCGICVTWLIREAWLHPENDVSELLDRMERELDNRGMNGLLATLTRGDVAAAITTATVDDLLVSHHVLDMWSTVGCAFRPRRHEVAMALTRARGMTFDLLPEKPKAVTNEEEEEEDPEVSKKRALAELWANRRKR